MALYKDTTDAIWIDTLCGSLACVIDPLDIPGVEADVIGEPFDAEFVRGTWGPLVEVRPTGWEEV